MISGWALEKLMPLKDEPFVVVQDPFRLLPETDGAMHRFARENGFTVIIAATNLVFRDLFEKASASKDVKKILLIDRTSARRKTNPSPASAPPLFYPDLLARTSPSARISIGLRRFLVEKTGDADWPEKADDPAIARLMAKSLEGVIQAHGNLRAADPSRFTDHDFQTIVAYAALGVPEAAFKKPDREIYWRIALMGHHALEDLGAHAPDVASAVRSELRKAPAPFRRLADSSPEPIVRCFYLAAVFIQHTDQWKLLLTAVDPELKPFVDMDPEMIRGEAPGLTAIDPSRACRDLDEAEAALSKEALALILVEQLNVFRDGRFAEIIEKERYSTLIRSLALLVALDDLLSDSPNEEAHNRTASALFSGADAPKSAFLDQRPCPACEHLTEAYRLTRLIRGIRDALDDGAKTLKVKKTHELTFTWFRSLWNERRVNRLEYYLSDLERLVYHAELIPRSEQETPAPFLRARDRIRERVSRLSAETSAVLAEVNARYQETVLAHYKNWIAEDSPEIVPASDFLRRCVKPHWDPEREKAVVFVFDGMRCDIWYELVRPLFEDRMEVIEDYPATALLPTETHISRKAIFAGAFPDSFDARGAENALLAGAMKREFGYEGTVEVVPPDGAGTGETVRYRAGGLDVFIFELCDKALHNIPAKTLPDGRFVPSRPLSFVYRRHIKDIIDTEVMAVVRGLAPATKVFVTSDHGFGPIGREPVRLDATWLNEPNDCFYLYALLKSPLSGAGAPKRVRESVLEFPVADLRMYDGQDVGDRASGRTWRKTFASIVFPKTGHAFARPHAKFRPDAYSHGGISLQEMLTPMTAMRVKASDEGLLILGPIIGPADLIEGESAEFRTPIHLTRAAGGREIRLEARADYRTRDETAALSPQIHYVAGPGGHVVFRFAPDPADASDLERKAGVMARTLRISVTYRHGGRTVRKTREFRFSVRLNSEKIVRRVPAHLGKILGLTPRSMK
jgi:hypothetical protein